MNKTTEASGFNEARFRRVWASLAEDVQDKIRDKARWEQMTLAAVMHEWWPRLWRKVVEEEPPVTRAVRRRRA